MFSYRRLLLGFGFMGVSLLWGFLLLLSQVMSYYGYGFYGYSGSVSDGVAKECISVGATILFQ